MSENEVIEFNARQLCIGSSTYCGPGSERKTTQICQRCYFGKDEPEKKIKTTELSHDDRHTLFEFIHRIDPTIGMIDHRVQKLFSQIDQIIFNLVNI